MSMTGCLSEKDHRKEHQPQIELELALTSPGWVLNAGEQLSEKGSEFEP